MIKHVARWKRIVIFSEEMGILAFKLRKLAAPNLEEFVLKLGEYGGDPEELMELDDQVFSAKIPRGGMPKLTHVSLNGRCSLPPLSAVTILRIEVNTREGYSYTSWPMNRQTSLNPSES